MIRKPTRQLRRLAARKGTELVEVQPEPAKMRLFHKACGTSLKFEAEEIMCPRCNAIITQDSEVELLPVV